MSWSVNAKGTAAEVEVELDRQFELPLAERTGLSDEGEKETVRYVRALIRQCVRTFDPQKAITVSAYGHMGGSSGQTDAYQNVNVSIS